MKRTLLILGALTFGQASFAQLFVIEDFSSFTVGNVGTDITEMETGQNGWYTLATNGAAPTTTTNAGNDNFQIVNLEDNGNVLQITGPNGDKGTRLAYQEGLIDFFTEREAGNDVLEAEFDFFTGPAASSSNVMRLVLYNADRTQMLTGINFNGETKEISGLAFYDNDGVGAGAPANYIFGLGPNAATPSVFLEEDVWVRVGISYNYATGEFIWKGPGFWSGSIGAAPGVEPAEADFIVSSGTTTDITNLAANDFWIDNIRIRALPESELLGVAQPIASASKFSVYPNPSNDIVNIRVAGNIMQAAEVVDLNGRIVTSVKLNGVSDASVNIANLSSGVYLLNVSTDNGKITKKIVKN